MIVDIKNCDINNDYFHFTNRKNVDSILNNGLIPSVYDVAMYVFERAKNIEVFRNMHPEFFDMFEMRAPSSNRECNFQDDER